ncbi:hypothetical protein FQN49_001753 [Arthroderma sp. PD_2]|nr:hypothetical protein FQN49_001753 [Arthroderma sp. PD_2]
MAANQPAAEVDDEENVKYPTGGAPPQPFRITLPYHAKEIITPRLVLIPLTHEHAPALVAVNAKLKDAWSKMPEMQSMLRYLVHGAPDAAALCKWMDSKNTQISEFEFMFYFGITLRDEMSEHGKPGRLIGAVGMNQVEPVPNLGYSIDADLWGKGYGTEAVRGLMETWWALPRAEDCNGKTEKVFANVNKVNTPSIKLLEKCGFNIYKEKTMADGEIMCLLAVERQLKI